MLNFASPNEEINPDVFRAYTRRVGIGCNAVKLRFTDGVQHHGTHIRRSVLPKDILAKLDSGVYLLLYYNF